MSTKNRIIAFVLTILIILNFAVPKLSYAAPVTQPTDTLEQIDSSMTKEGIESMMSDGATNVKSQTYDGDNNVSEQTKNISLQPGMTVGSSIIRLLVSIFVIVPYILNSILSLIVGTNTFTIEELLTNQYDIVDIKFWDTNTSGTNASTVNTIRKNVATWYYSIRNIAIIAMVVILIYIAIRLAILIASKESSPNVVAQYKRLFVNWLVGLVLLVILHFLLIFFITLIDQFTKIIINIFQSSIPNSGLEIKLIDDSWKEIWSPSNKHPFWEAIIYFMLVFYEIKFFISYFLRAIKIYFYILISPLVCMTYAIDKVKDNRSQAFDNWTRELISEVLTQPIHLLTYAVFIFSANALMETAPILMVLMLFSIGKIEKTIRNSFMMKPGRFAKGPGDISLVRPTEWMKIR